jgi:phosphopantothenoylcysteine decarboxylase/phosphopantothenate--cysteine ligase
MSKMASGNSDNFLLATYLSAKCPVYFAPAMDLDMYKHPSTKASFETLISYGNTIIPAGSGELASGLVGEGRMAEPEDIVKIIEADVLSKLPLRNKKVLITAGPTYEAIDPVRFIGNHSSGKMGFELANVVANLGAEVVLISGPTNETISNSFTTVVPVVSALDMYEKTHEYFPSSDIVICAAAVADYTPKNVAEHKIKKKTEEFSIELTKTKDILASLGEIKNKQILVGFALETANEVENAKGKLQRKNLDFIVLNSLQDKGAGFGKPTNKITIIDRDESLISFELKSKKEVANDIVNHLLQKI